jgi:hypothetical protein
MGKSSWSTGLAIIFAFVGFMIGGPSGAQLGWFIGSTVGSFLDLQDGHSTTMGARTTDFKAMNSKYGIPIQRGFGTVRLSSNIIWTSAITEWEDRDTTCVKTKGLFGTSLGETNQCQTKVTFRYTQSVAFAFAEGPATSITKIWGDGELIFSTDSPFRTKEGVFTDPDSEDGETSGSFEIFLGSLTQPVHPAIAQELGTEATAFRSIVYILAEGINLNNFGYRLPVITAEVSFLGGTYGTLSNIALDIPVNGDQVSPTFDTLGAVSKKPGLGVGANASGNGSIAVHDLVDGTLRYDIDNVYPDGVPSGFVRLSTDFISIRKVIEGSGSYFGPFDVPSNRQIFTTRLNGANYGQIAYMAYDSANHRIWCTFSGGACVGFSLTAISPEIDSRDREVLFTEQFERRWSPLNNGYWAFTNGGGTTDPGREVFVTDGRVYWLVDGAGGVWVNSVRTTSTNRGSQQPADTYARVQFDDSSNVSSVLNWTYESRDDSFILYVDVAGTSPVGLYKIARTAIGATGTTVKLPLSTDAANYLSLSPADPSAFQYGPVGSYLRLALNTADLAVVDTSTMELVETKLAVPGGLSTLGTVPSPNLMAVRGSSDNLIYFGGTRGQGESLDSVITYLMTTQDGDLRERLVASDLDVSELTGETVKGYPLLGQQTVRNAVTPLQQLYMFDVLESDGKLKFIKRPQTPSFTMVEDDLAAHEYGKTDSRTLIPVEYNRKSEIELPREVVVNYTDFDLDYNQGTQRYRKLQTESQSNTQSTLPIVLTADEAAQAAERLLKVTWSERQAPFKFKTGMKYILVEPTDSGTITMNDGKVHDVRIVSSNLGSNNVMEFVATNEIASVYSSEAVGGGSANPPQVLTNYEVVASVVDTSAAFLTSYISSGGQPGVIVGLGSYGTTFNGATSQVLSGGGALAPGGSRDSTQGMTFGNSATEVGHVNGPESGNTFDYETTIVMNVLGGAMPTTKTEAQALVGDPSGLLILGREIIAFTNVVASDDISATGTDISFVNGTSSIDSVSTDFLAAGFVAGQALRISGATNNDNSTYWEIASVTQFQIVLTNAPTTEAAGASITVFLASRSVTFSGGLLRGLYGTESFMYHEKGEEMLLAESLMFVPVSQNTTGVVTIVAYPDGGGKSYYDSTSFSSAAVKPWSPVDAVATDLTNDISLQWLRRDKDNGAGLLDESGTVLNSEGSENWEIDILDAYDEARENDIKRTVAGLITATYTYPEADQIIDWGAVKDTPLLVDIYQISSIIGRGYRYRTVVTKDQEYAPAGENFVNETPAIAYSLGTNRMDAGASLIEGSGDISPNGLRVATGTDNQHTAVSFNQAATVSDIEVLTVIEMQAGSLSGLSGGVILRGRGTSTASLSGAVVGLGGASNNEFAISHYVNGYVDSVFSASSTFAWSTVTKYSIRARYYRHRIQAKVWVYGNPEPGAWQLDYYDKGVGPNYGWVAPFAYRTGNDPLYHYFAWAHRGLTAA